MSERTVRVLLCDRCGNVVSVDGKTAHLEYRWGHLRASHVNGPFQIKGTSLQKDAPADICEPCTNDLEIWWNAKTPKDDGTIP